MTPLTPLIVRDACHVQVALATFDRAVHANGENPHSLNNRGALLRELGEYERALPDFHRAIGLNPNYAVAMRNRNETLEQLGEPVPLSAVVEPMP